MTKNIAIIGGGPSGLMAADILSDKGYSVTIYERKPSMGRKFLMAGRGGLNITHSENLDDFIKKYGSTSDIFKPLLDNFTPQNLRDWCADLGQKTFVGSSGRVFPESFKASPLLRAWITRLGKQGVQFRLNHDWQGWDEDMLTFHSKGETVQIQADATLLALGGASWPRLGSDGSWAALLKAQDVEVMPLLPANCGFTVNWTPFLAERFAGKPLKSIDISFQNKKVRGEFIITENGVEGGVIYTLSSFIRDEILQNGLAQITINLKPDISIDEMHKRLQRPRAKLSLSNYLRKTLKLSDIAIGLLMEKLDRKNLSAYTPEQLTQHIKEYKIELQGVFAIDKAISTAGGVTFKAIDENFMLHKKPNVFVTGEMLDWEAPTGGYLLQAGMASGVHVANGIINHLEKSA